MYNVTSEYVCAFCRKGIFYYYRFKGSEKAYKSLMPGDLVTVYYADGFNPEVVALDVSQTLGRQEDTDDGETS